MSDLISREEFERRIKPYDTDDPMDKALYNFAHNKMIDCPSAEPERKIGYCKGCKYFEYDSVAKVDGIPLIVAHEICNRWGNGCKTSEDGYCFMYDPQEMEEEE